MKSECQCPYIKFSWNAALPTGYWLPPPLDLSGRVEQVWQKPYGPQIKKHYHLPLYWQICYLLTPGLDSMLKAGLSIGLGSLNFPKKHSAVLCYWAAFLVNWGPVLQRQAEKGLPMLSPALLCPSDTCIPCTSQAALFGSQPASGTQCTREFRLSNHMGTISNFWKYHRKIELYMEICVKCVTMISISYKETISTAQPYLNHWMYINHSMICDVIKLHHNSECLIACVVDSLAN